MRTALIALLGGLMADQALAVNYCDSRAGSARYEWITGVAALPGVTQSSGMDNGYRDATGLAPLPLKYTGASIGLRAVRSSGRTNPLYWGAWIDFNQNGLFESSERVLQGQGLAPPQRAIRVPANTRPGITRMRVQLRADSDAQPCGYYAYGETEDYRVELPAAVATYRLDLQAGFWVERSGELGDNLTLVVQRDDQIVLERNAAGNLRDRYWDNRPGSHYQLWLKAFRNGAYEVVSNRVSYRPGITDSVGLVRQPDGAIKATVPFVGDWVLERNGQTELRQPALDGVPFQFPFQFGERYRVWVESRGVAAQPLSVPLVFRQGFPDPFIDLQVEGDFSLRYTTVSTEPLNWVIEENGIKVFEQPTGGQQVLRYPFAQGSKYKVWLSQAVAGEMVRVSDAEYFSPGLTDSYQLQVNAGQLSRSGAIGDPLTWVIEVNGEVVLKRYAANELHYSYASPNYRAWLTRFVDGYYQRVSNQVTVGAAVEPDPYALSIDAAGTLTRGGVLGESLWWLIEQDGVVVLRRMANNEMSYRYSYHAGQPYRMWLEQLRDGRYQRVSPVLQHTGIEQYQISSDGYGTLSRSGSLGDRVQWIIEEEGKVVMRRLASNELSYFDNFFDPMRSYRAWMQAENGYHPISKAVSYGGQQAQPYLLSMSGDRVVTRSAGITPGLEWVVEEGGAIVRRLSVSTAGQLTYRHSSYYPGKVYRVWLEALVDGVQRPVSMVLTY